MRISEWGLTAWFIAAMIISGPSVFAQTLMDSKDAPAVSDAGNPTATDKPESIRVYMPDGQLKSHPIRVYVTKNISSDQNPQLRLLRNNAKQEITTENREQEAIAEAAVVAVAPNQEWTELINGQQMKQRGTLMLFDINNMSFGCKSMTRVTPVVSWNKGKHIAIGAREVNVGSIVTAVLWTVFVVGLVLATLILLSKNKPLLFYPAQMAIFHLQKLKLPAGLWR